MKWFEQINLKSYQLPENRDQNLFRIIPFDLLLQILNEKENTLVRTSLWEDVYENFLLKENFKYQGEVYSINHAASRFFGQCWSSRSVSDAMWRIYSPDKKSVRIKTTVGRLWDSVQAGSDGGCLYLGKVQYFQQTKIRDDLIASSPFSARQINNLIISSLFAKRSSFSHESEYRLIYDSSSNSDDYNRNVKRIKMEDPLALIMNIYFDSRADKAYVDRCAKILVKAFGYPKDRIHKSSLYDFEPCTIEIR